MSKHDLICSMRTNDQIRLSVVLADGQYVNVTGVYGPEGFAEEDVFLAVVPVAALESDGPHSPGLVFTREGARPWELPAGRVVLEPPIPVPSVQDYLGDV